MNELKQNAEEKLVETCGYVIPLTAIDYVEKVNPPDKQTSNWLARIIKPLAPAYQIQITYSRGKGVEWTDINLEFPIENTRDAAYSKLVAALEASGVLVGETKEQGGGN